MADRILYFMDRTGVSSGYQRIFQAMVKQSGVNHTSIMQVSIYNEVKDVVRRKGQAKAWTMVPGKREEIQACVDKYIRMFKPSAIAVSCPGVAGMLSDSELSVEKLRGSTFFYQDIPCIVLYPINAVNLRIDSKNTFLDENGEPLEGAQQYKVKTGTWILRQDWGKVGRYFHGNPRTHPEFRYSVIRRTSDFDSASKYLNECVAISTDIETVRSGKSAEISCIGYAGLRKDGAIKSFVVPFFDAFKDGGCYWDMDDSMRRALLFCREINATKAIKIMANGSYDSSYYIKDLIPVNAWLLDTQHMWHSINPEMRKSLDFLSSILLDNYVYWKEDIKGIKEGGVDKNMETYWRYNALDCYNTLLVAASELTLINSADWAKFNYHKEFMQAISGLKMSMRGVKADKVRLARHEVELQEKADLAVARIQKLTDDPDFNPRSVPERKSLIYDVLGAAKVKVKGKTGGTDAITFKLISTQHPIFKLFIDAMNDANRPRKQISNICQMSIPTDRFRTAMGVNTETWRYNSKSSNFWDGTNAQNITKVMRDWLVSDTDYILFDVDYSQSDAAFIAFESQDKAYMKTMSSGKDTHAIHAEHFFKIPYDTIREGVRTDDPEITHPTKGIRNLTKRVVHGANFQMAARTLFLTMGRDAVVSAARLLEYSYPEKLKDRDLEVICGKLLAGYRDLYPRLSRKPGGWYSEIQDILKETGRIQNAFGMTRLFNGSWDDNATQREATAFYGQSGTAGNMNRVLDEIHFGWISPTFRDGPNPHAKEKPYVPDPKKLSILLQVHDSFVGIVHKDHYKTEINNLLTVMERPVIIHGREVRVPTDAEVGLRWGKGMIPWNRKDPYSLDRITVKAS